MAIEFEFDLGRERDGVREWMQRWLKARRPNWREQHAPDAAEWIERQVKAIEKGRKRSYYERLAEKADYVSPQVAEMYVGFQDVRNEAMRDLEFFFGARFGWLKGYGPADALWNQGVEMIQSGRGIAEVGPMLERGYGVMVEAAKREHAAAETERRMAEETRLQSMQAGQERLREGRL